MYCYQLVLLSSSSGYYPLFKPGVDSLGGQALHVEIRRTSLVNKGSGLEEESTGLEVLVSQSLIIDLFTAKWNDFIPNFTAMCFVIGFLSGRRTVTYMWS